MRKYVVRRSRGSHTVFTFPPVPSVKGSGWAWSPTRAGGVAARPSWHEPRAVLAGTCTYGARIGIPGSSVADEAHVSVLRTEAVERVRDVLMDGALDALSRFRDGCVGEVPTCLVCVVGEPLTVVGFNEDARLGKLPEGEAAGRVGFDAVCEVGFHAYPEVPRELAGAADVVVFPFEGDLARKSIWDAVDLPAFRWMKGIREGNPEVVRAWLSAQFPDDSTWRFHVEQLHGPPDPRCMVWVGLEILPDPNVPADASVQERVRAALEYRKHCGGERHAKLLPVYEKLREMCVPMKPARDGWGRAAEGGDPLHPGEFLDSIFLVDDLDADPFFPVAGAS